MDEDYKRFCRKCNWNDPDRGCACPPYEEVFQCKMYAYYNPEDVAKFENEMEEWMRRNGENIL